MKRTILLAPLLLSGCIHDNVWVKSGATQMSFSQDRFACLQSSQQPASTAFVNQYGGSSDSGIITNATLFSACMNARGYVWMPREQAQQTVSR